MKIQCTMKIQWFGALALSVMLAACGGGGDSDEPTPNTGGSGTQAGTDSTGGGTGSTGGTTGGTGTTGGSTGSGGSSTGGATGYVLTPTRYEVFKAGTAGVLSGAGALSNNVLTLDGGFTTTLTVNDPEGEFSISATGFDGALNRRDGAVLLLCRNVPGSFPRGAYAAVAVESTVAATQAVRLNNLDELRGQTLTEIDCDNETATVLVDSNGGIRLTFQNGESPESFAPQQASALFSPTGLTFDRGTVYGTAYKFVVSGQTRYFGVIRTVPSQGSGEPPNVFIWGSPN